MGGVADAVEDAVGDVIDAVEDIHKAIIEAHETVIREIAGVLGIKSRDETVVDVQISNLLNHAPYPKVQGAEDNSADRQARRAAIKSSSGSAMQYMHTYKAFQRDYRRKYSKNFLQSVGYAPSVTASTRVADGARVLTHIQDTSDPLAETLVTVLIKYISSDEAAYDWMEDNIGWSNSQRKAFDGGKVWEKLLVSEDDTTIYMDFTREPQETVLQNLTDNYAFDDAESTVEIDGALYDVTTPFDEEVIDEKYSTIATKQEDSSQVLIETPLEYAQWTIPLSTTNGEKMFVKYNRDTSEWYHFIDDKDNIPSNLYTSIDVDITAIIPLKENNTIVDSTGDMRRMLTKLNVEYETFKSNLDNPDIDSAYVMTGIHPDAQTPGGMKAIYQMFDLMLPGSGDVSITMSELSMTYSFTMVKETIAGSVLPHREYSNQLIEGEVTEGDLTLSTFTKILTYQADELEYKKITITNYTQTYNISGQSIIVSLGDGPLLSRMVLPLSVLNGLNYRDFVDVYDNSLCFLAYSEEVVHYEWYESASFGALIKIVGVVAILVTAGGATPVVVSANVAINAAVGIALAVGTAIALGVALHIVMDFLVDALGLDPILAGLIIAATAAAIGASPGMALGQEQWLAMANSVINEVNAQQMEQVQEILDEDAEDQKDFEKKNQEVLDLISNQAGNDPVVSINNMNSHELASPEQTVNGYYYTKKGEAMYDWDRFNQQAIDMELKRRKTISYS